jgi:hypothetical protein
VPSEHLVDQRLVAHPPPARLLAELIEHARIDTDRDQFSGEQAKAFLASLKTQREAIEGELGYPLEWEELPSRRDCRIASYFNDVDPENEADWLRQHEWLAKRLNDLHRVLAPRVKTLEAVQPDDPLTPSASV